MAHFIGGKLSDRGQATLLRLRLKMFSLDKMFEAINGAYSIASRKLTFVAPHVSYDDG